MLWLLACAEPDPPKGRTDPTPVDTADTAAADCGTWEDIGHPFVLSWCTACHASALPEGLRAGAPVGVDLDTLDGVREWSDRVAARALVDLPTMPTGGGPTAAERAAVRDWLACGAPGEGTRITPGEAPAGLSDAGVAGLFVEEEGGEIVSELTEGNLPVLTFRFTRDDDGTGAWLGWSRYADGARVEAASFDPPLPVYDPRRTAWTAEATATVETDTGVATEATSWSFRREAGGELDPRVGDTDAELLVAEEAGGERHRWWLSSRYGAVLETHARVEGRETVVLYGTRAFGTDVAGFSIVADTGGSGWFWTREAP